MYYTVCWRGSLSLSTMMTVLERKLVTIYYDVCAGEEACHYLLCCVLERKLVTIYYDVCWRGSLSTCTTLCSGEEACQCVLHCVLERKLVTIYYAVCWRGSLSISAARMNVCSRIVQHSYYPSTVAHMYEEQIAPRIT